MIRKEPKGFLHGVPCSIVAVTTACDLIKGTTYTENYPELKENGWSTLEETNKYLRANLKVKRKTYFKRSERVRLKDLHFKGKAIVCVYGHLIYLENETYYSFFNNENDKVVCVWEISDKNEMKKVI